MKVLCLNFQLLEKIYLLSPSIFTAFVPKIPGKIVLPINFEEIPIETYFSKGLSFYNTEQYYKIWTEN